MSSAAPEEADESLRVAHERLGRVLNQKYRLDRVLGVGGMAAVYAATHRNGSAKALKILHPWISAHRELRGRFLAEGYTANRIRHPSIVVVHDDDVDEDGAAYLVMDLLEGQTFEARRLAAGGRLAVPEVLSAAHALLDVLALAHEAGIVHRDIKPDNLFLTTEGLVKVLDFGIARVRELSGGRATRTGVAMGTPAFMPPEQALGQVDRIGPRSDLWSVGATMFTLLSGRTVHEASTVQAIFIAAATSPAPSLARVAPEVPAAVAALVDRALAFDVEARWPDARAMQAAVDAEHPARPSAASAHVPVATPPLAVDLRPTTATPTVPLSAEHFLPAAPPWTPPGEAAARPSAAAARPSPLTPTVELAPRDFGALRTPVETAVLAGAATTGGGLASGNTAPPESLVLPPVRPRGWVLAASLASAAAGVALLALFATRAGSPTSPSDGPASSATPASSPIAAEATSSAAPTAAASASPSSSAPAPPPTVAASTQPRLPERKTAASASRPAPKPPASAKPAVAPTTPAPTPAAPPAAPAANPRSKYD